MVSLLVILTVWHKLTQESQEKRCRRRTTIVHNKPSYLNPLICLEKKWHNFTSNLIVGGLLSSSVVTFIFVIKHNTDTIHFCVEVPARGTLINPSYGNRTEKWQPKVLTI